jgi:DNA-binding NarL/FixJ family response regulator
MMTIQLRKKTRVKFHNMTVNLRDNYKFDKLAIEWRRSVVLQKLSQGYNQSEIAKELQLHPSTISLDCQWIRERNKQNIQTFVSEKFQRK